MLRSHKVLFVLKVQLIIDLISNNYSLSLENKICVHFVIVEKAEYFGTLERRALISVTGSIGFSDLLLVDGERKKESGHKLHLKDHPTDFFLYWRKFPGW